MRLLSVTVLAAMVISSAACGDDSSNPSSDDREPSTTPDLNDSDDEAVAGDDDGDDEAVAGNGGGDGTAAGRVTIDGTTYEITDVLDCSVGNGGAADDRQFVGESADGNARMDVAYIDNEELSSLNAVALVLKDPERIYSSMFVPDGTFDISPRSDGADGTATVAATGIDPPTGEFQADWSFTC